MAKKVPPKPIKTKEPPPPDPPADPRYDVKRIGRCYDEIAGLLGPLSEADAQILSAILVRMSTYDSDNITRILTTYAG